MDSEASDAQINNATSASNRQSPAKRKYTKPTAKKAAKSSKSAKISEAMRKRWANTKKKDTNNVSSRTMKLTGTLKSMTIENGKVHVEVDF